MTLAWESWMVELESDALIKGEVNAKFVVVVKSANELHNLVSLI